jgi:hypothetical protein
VAALQLQCARSGEGVCADGNPDQDDPDAERKVEASTDVDRLKASERDEEQAQATTTRRYRFIEDRR